MSDKVKFNLPRTYEVGYAKPPEKSRFKPGISGNAKGRPKGAKNKASIHLFERLNQLILQEADRKVSILEGGKTKKITIIEANIRSMANNGAKGNIRAAVHFTTIVKTIEDQNASDHWELMRNAIHYKEDWYEELARQKSLGLKGPRPLPHPDHVQIDRITGDVWFSGPATKEQAGECERHQRKIDENDAHIRELEKILTDRHHKKIRKHIEIEIEFERKKNEAIKTALHDVIYNYRGG